MRIATTICLLLLVVVSFSCSDQDGNEVTAVRSIDNATIELLKKKYDLIELSSNSLPQGMHPAVAKNYEEAVAVLEQARSFRTELLKNEEFQVNVTHPTDPSGRSMFMCENSWMNASLGGAGLLSSWSAMWYQGSSGASQVSMEPVGFQIGWSWQQTSTHNLSRNDFCVQGMVQFGIDVGGMVLGSRDRYHVNVRLERDCTVTASEGYGFCGM